MKLAVQKIGLLLAVLTMASMALAQAQNHESCRPRNETDLEKAIRQAKESRGQKVQAPCGPSNETDLEEAIRLANESRETAPEIYEGPIADGRDDERQRTAQQEEDCKRALEKLNQAIRERKADDLRRFCNENPDYSFCRR